MANPDKDEMKRVASFITNTQTEGSVTHAMVGKLFTDIINSLNSSEGGGGDEGGGGGGGTDPVQYINGTITRIRYWNSIPEGDKIYGGEVQDDQGVKYLDIVYYETNYYRLKNVNSYTTKSSSAPSSSNQNSIWEVFNFISSAAFNAMIATYGFIENLTSRELVITDDNGNPIAGMTRGTAVSGDGDAINNYSRGSIRIWAGTPTNANLGNCPFYVTQSGFLKALEAEIRGVIESTNTEMGNTIRINANNTATAGNNGAEFSMIGPVTINEDTKKPVDDKRATLARVQFETDLDTLTRFATMKLQDGKARNQLSLDPINGIGFIGGGKLSEDYGSGFSHSGISFYYGNDDSYQEVTISANGITLTKGSTTTSKTWEQLLG